MTSIICIFAMAGVKELRKIAPLRRWNLVEIDAELSKLTMETKSVLSLIYPSNTYMDLNIGIAFWLVAGGDGCVSEEINGNNNLKVKYKSDSRILLVGSGADEQCGGYGRHRTKFRESSWGGLNKEMKLDMQRIWKRNLGRDDRCIVDNGKEVPLACLLSRSVLYVLSPERNTLHYTFSSIEFEWTCVVWSLQARFPFLDENVIRILLDIPLWEIADLGQPIGVGDKILRKVSLSIPVLSLLNFHVYMCTF
uniref:Asparagine synthetase domain-containing protein n=1 Tax=Lactuca sativa TaxID=4236 RepID=A0A9R1XAL9_LACSA|nr:hypothetical protein LSAT_V11C500280280 [Lactuca sativa]